MEQNIGLSRDLGFLRIGAAVPDVHVADVEYNVKNIISLIEKATLLHRSICNRQREYLPQDSLQKTQILF